MSTIRQTLCQGPQLARWLLACSHLQAGDGEPAGVVRQRGDGDGERRVGDVLIIKLDGHLIVTWREGVRGKMMMMFIGGVPQDSILGPLFCSSVTFI